jgi:DNA-directed RNA polymerase subunit F
MFHNCEEENMNEERKKVLDLLAEGKITAEEADRLLEAISKEKGYDSSISTTSNPKYIRIMVEPSEGSPNQEKVNIRVPLKLIHAGLKLASFIPKDAQGKVNEALQGKGIETDFSKIKPEDLDEIIHQLSDLTVDVEGKETVKIFCE